MSSMSNRNLNRGLDHDDDGGGDGDGGVRVDIDDKAQGGEEARDPDAESGQRWTVGRHLDGAHYHYQSNYPSSSDLDGKEKSSTNPSGNPNSNPPTPDLENGTTHSLGSLSSSTESHDTSELFENRDGIRDVRDRDQSPRSHSLRCSLRHEREQAKHHDANLVTWTGPSDPHNPKNWAFKRKWAATIVVSIFTFISPVSSSMVAPALGSIAEEFRIERSVEQSLVLSIFLLAYAVGPLILGPLSELYGRTIVLQLSNLFFLVFNLGCGLSRTKSQIIVFRFLSGLGGSAPLALGGGVLSDLFVAEERGKAISIYSLAPLLGPAVGPIAGSFIAAHTTWRWAFYATSIADGLIQVLGFFYLQETYAPVLLARKKERLVRETGNRALHTEYDRPDRTLGKTLRGAVSRPFVMLGTQPIIQVLALYMAFLYGLMYLMLSTFPRLFHDVYRQPLGTSGLNYISLGLGFFLGTQSCAPVMDVIYRRLKYSTSPHIHPPSSRAGEEKDEDRGIGTGRPEFRVPLMLPASLLVPIGLFLYGWTAGRTHFIVPNIGACIFAAGQQMGFQCVQTYVVDAYSRYAASAVGAVTVLRSLAGFGFPLWAPYMWQRLGYGPGGSLLGGVAVVLGVPAPIGLWYYGRMLREKSRFAAG